MADARRNIRQSDIARAAGVSQATVSLVLQGNARISAGTRSRVMRVLREMGYSANVPARLLRRGRSNFIGVYTYAPVFPVSAEDYFHDFLLGVERAAVRRGNDLVLFTSTEGEDGRRRIYARGENRLMLADGAVILGVEYDAEELIRLAGDGYPFVFIGRREIPGLDAPYVTADYRSAAARVADLVHRHGHRRVAYLAGAVRRGPLDERRTGFEGRARELGIEIDGPHALSAGELTGALIDRVVGAGATCLLVETAVLAERLADLVAERGMRVPDDVSVVFLDTGPRAWGDRASVLGVPREEMGRVAVDLLLARVDASAVRVESVVLECTAPSTATLTPVPLG